MPNINDIKNSKKRFKKRNYRSHNMDGIEKPSSDAETESRIDKPAETQDISTGVLNINPNKVKNWKYHDRTEASFGDIDGLANEFKTIGQQQPCIVRPSPANKNEYELIIGERRWRAAQKAGVDLQVIVRSMDDTDAALSQAAENDNRESLSDYEKGMSFSKLIDDGVIKQKDLTEKLGRSKQYVSALLSYNQIPDIIQNEISDFKNVSAKTAERIKQLSSKGDEYIVAISSLAQMIRSGKMGSKNLDKAVDGIINGANKIVIKEKVCSKDGRHIFTWRKDNNHLPSMHFPKDIVKLLDDKDISLEDLNSKFLRIIEDALSSIREERKK